MKYSITLLFLLLSFLPFAQFFYGPPITTPNIRLYEGGGCKVDIDWNTSLDELVKRLESDWDWEFTGKGYWLGYTDDMYSIAARKDEAIEPLRKLIRNTESLHTKRGALATLHLIGIESTIPGRHYEFFTNGYVRVALLRFLRDKEVADFIMWLLNRDPWVADIPYLMEYLAAPSNDYDGAISLLQRYRFPGQPLNQPVPENFFPSDVCLERGLWLRGSSVARIRKMLESTPSVSISCSVQESPEWNREPIYLNNRDKRLEDCYLNYELLVATNTLPIGYGDDHFDYIYSFKDNELQIFRKEEAREIWLEWWNNK